MGWGWGGLEEVVFFFTKNANQKKKYIFSGGGRGGAIESDFFLFTKTPNLKEKFFGRGWGEGGYSK